MSRIHFLNVGEGDCTWIAHNSGHNTVVDVSCAKQIVHKAFESYAIDSHGSLSGNYNQKAYPDNPISYLKKFGVSSVFRFILTHPDMDHMDGIKAFFEEFEPINFYDTANNKTMGKHGFGNRYDYEDWSFYQTARQRDNNPHTMHLYAGSKGKYYNENEDGTTGGDGLHFLAPTKSLVDTANVSGDYNNCSYVVLYYSTGRKVLLAGDSGEETWDYIIENYRTEVSDIDVLIAPHHGRATGGNNDYLDVLCPKFSLLGNADSEFLDYDAWNRRNLRHITNNQAGNIILDIVGKTIKIYVQNEAFANNWNTHQYDSNLEAYYIGNV